MWQAAGGDPGPMIDGWISSIGRLTELQKSSEAKSPALSCKLTNCLRQDYAIQCGSARAAQVSLLKKCAQKIAKKCAKKFVKECAKELCRRTV